MMKYRDFIKIRHLAIVISLAIHVAIFFSSKKGNVFKNRVKKDYIEIALVDSAKKDIKLDLKEDKKIIEKKFKNKKITKIKNQIVENGHTGENKVSDTRFLSDKNQKYLRETVARNRGKFKIGHSKINQKKSLLKSRKNKKITLSSLSMNGFFNKKLIVDNKDRSFDSLKEKIASSNNDFITDVPLGDFTHLNTRKFKYFSFYQRIKRRLELHWGNELRAKITGLYKQGRRLPSSTNLITSLKIVLNKKGEIIKIIVQGKSGIRELDNVAIRTFNKAGPFPNPPKGMLNNGIAVIEWGFVVNS